MALWPYDLEAQWVVRPGLKVQQEDQSGLFGWPSSSKDERDKKLSVRAQGKEQKCAKEAAELAFR